MPGSRPGMSGTAADLFQQALDELGIELNRAIALAETEGPQTGLRIVDGLGQRVRKVALRTMIYPRDVGKGRCRRERLKQRGTWRSSML